MANIDTWLTDSVIVAARTDVDAWGDPTFGSQVTVTCRIEEETGVITAISGNQIEYGHKLTTTTAITKQSRVWLSADDETDDTEAKRVLKVVTARSKSTALRLYEVFV